MIVQKVIIKSNLKGLFEVDTRRHIKLFKKSVVVD